MAAPVYSEPRIPFRVVGLASSEGGLDALREILFALPGDFPAALVVVQHLSPHYKSYLAPILARHTTLQVKQAEEGDRLKPGHVFVAPPDKHLLVNPDGTLSLGHSGYVHYLRPSGDVLFASMAVSCKDRAIAVVLTGGDGDGSIGVKLVKAMGGTVIAQDEASSMNFAMPCAAIATGAVDYILPPGQIPILLGDLANNGYEGAQQNRDLDSRGRKVDGHARCDDIRPSLTPMQRDPEWAAHEAVVDKAG